MTPADPPARGAALTRERLLAAALDAFGTSGFDGVSAREIERRAGVERGLIAYHFGSKEKLWEACVDHVYGGFADSMFALGQALRDVSPKERRRAFLLAYVRFNSAHPEFFRMLVLEGHRRTDRSRHLAQHLRRGVALFMDRDELADHADGSAPTEITMIDTMTMFQIIGAAGTLFAATAYLDQPVEDALRTPEATEQFAQSVAARMLARSPDLVVEGES